MAHGGAGRLSMAVPLICLACLSPNLKRLLRKTICSTAISDGGYDPKGRVYADGKQSGEQISISTSEVPLAAYRLRDNYRRVLINVMSVSAFSQSGGNFVLRVYHIPAPAVDPLTGGTWRDVNASYSAVEINTTPTAVTLTNSVKVDEIYVVNQSRNSFAGTDDRFGLQLTSDIQGNTDVVVITGETFSGTVNNVSAASQWQEFE